MTNRQRARAIALELYAAGEPITRIADAYGVAPRSFHRLASRLGVRRAPIAGPGAINPNNERRSQRGYGDDPAIAGACHGGER